MANGCLVDWTTGQAVTVNFNMHTAKPAISDPDRGNLRVISNLIECLNLTTIQNSLKPQYTEILSFCLIPHTKMLLKEYSGSF